MTCEPQGLKPQRFLAGLLTLILLAFAGTGAGCNKAVSDKNLVFVDPPDAEKLLVTENKSFLGLGKEGQPVLVDPRSRADYLKEHIEGAIHMPFETVAAEHGQLDGYTILIVYGNDYVDPIAEAMSKRLIELGHSDVRTLRGGLRAWEENGGEIKNGIDGD